MKRDRIERILADERLLAKIATRNHITPDQFRQELTLALAVHEAVEAGNREKIREAYSKLIAHQRSYEKH